MEESKTAKAFILDDMAKCNCNKGLEAIYVCTKSEEECEDSKN